MAYPVSDSYSALSGDVIAAGRSYYNAVIREIFSNGTQTMGSSPLSVIYDGAIYVGWLTPAGTVGVSKIDLATNTKTQFSLKTGFENNSHNNATVFVLPDGRIFCAWSKHNETPGLIHYRISTNPGNISAFSAEQTISVNTENSYNHVFGLSSNGKTYVMYRGGDWTMKVRASTDLSTWDAERTFISNPPQRPYPSVCSNGVDRVDFVFTSGNAGETQCSLYHGYMQIVGGVEKFYKSDGTEATRPLTPANTTLIYDGSVNSGWSWGIKRDLNGYPRVLFTKYIAVGTDHRHMFSRWNGAAWTTPVEITPTGGYLYASQPHSDGQSCFDSNDLSRVYLSKKTTGKKILEEWRTSDNGLTWAFHAALSDGVLDAFTPSSPVGHNGKMRVVWNDGTMTTYTSGGWSVAMKGL